MKALTLWRPWPRLVSEFGKDVENRGWRPPESLLGKWLALHAGRKVDWENAQRFKYVLATENGSSRWGMTDDELVGSEGIVGVCMVTGWIHAVEGQVLWGGAVGETEAGRILDGLWFSGPYGWVLHNVVALPEPLPCKGRQGLWNVPKTLVAEIVRQIGREP